MRLRWWVFIVITFLLIAGSSLAWFDLFNFEEIADIVGGFGKLAALIYLLLYFSLVIFGFPSAILTVAAGLVFGVRYGFLIDLFSSMFTAVFAFLGARYFNNFFDKYMSGSGKKIKIRDFLYKEAKNDGFSGMLLLRFSFVPFILVSYFAGLIKHISFSQFFLATLISNSVFGFITIYFGSSLRTGSVDLLISISLFFIVLFGVIIFRKTKGKSHKVY